MNLDGSETSKKCVDYVQFARDVLAFTTYRSNEFCGQRRKIDFRSEDDAFKSFVSKNQRLYVEEKDAEMDIFLKVSRGRGPGDDRNLTLVVTAFKKRCQSSKYDHDHPFLKCPHTEGCIRKELFCDGMVNCAWPDGDIGTDEAFCDAEGRYAGLGGDVGGAYDDITSASNIPIIIIVIIVVIGICLVFFMALRHVYRYIFFL